MTDNAFTEAERAAVYRAIGERRDMRHFSGGTVEPELLQRLLEALAGAEGDAAEIGRASCRERV